MAQTNMTNINIRMDEDTKAAFEQFCEDIGLSVSAAFNVFAKTVVREQRIPFDLKSERHAETAKSAEPIAKSDETAAGDAR